MEFSVVLENVRSDHKERQPSLGDHTSASGHTGADADEKRHMDDIHAYLQANDGSGFAVGSQGWAHQFQEALDPGDSLVLHIITLPWKLIFATVAPTSYCGGW